MRILSLLALAGLLSTPAFAQVPGDPGIRSDPGTKFGEPPASANELPTLPGDEKAGEDEMGITTEQTPPEQEDVIPLDQVPPGQPEVEPDEPVEPNVLDDEFGNTPQFDRDATPRSTQPERQEERRDPEGGLELEEALPEGGVEADIIPSPEDETRQDVEGEEPDYPDDRVPLGPPDEIRGNGQGDEEAPADVQPTIIPDRRFETFDSGMAPIQGGTPQPLAAPEADGGPSGTPAFGQGSF